MSIQKNVRDIFQSLCLLFLNFHLTNHQAFEILVFGILEVDVATVALLQFYFGQLPHFFVYIFMTDLAGQLRACSDIGKTRLPLKHVGKTKHCSSGSRGFMIVGTLPL